MEFTIKEPVTDTVVRLSAEPEDYNGQQGWRILYPDKESFVIVKEGEDWKVVDEEDFNPEILSVIVNGLRERANNPNSDVVF
ncbi:MULTISPECIES: hypothetical protein [Olivibacter]|jgi:hypothetical protein|uniref:Uncharacterized protein n=3 Tax=Sphingobacteriaceae TaxID=84566 RepID=F4C4A2_SPHS2|nr:MULTISPECIES: hypothetical protein [Olivibacter]MCL4638939.1 hypothetical protein [Olivibacter sp. UJ_SKK_5.1]MDM8175470.1 hypothetical protein [Olivibacter sp. 47]MDX3914080.1 hypothetical protein [Pseudosphingobacterium sp.]QEL02225.1 hypothetical protein FKG96_15875 [Olivibacter sp. LS-1]